MNIIQAILLGIVQGITEFLPISSSAHLVIVPFLLGWKLPSDQVFPFDVLIQLGTVIALLIYFYKDLKLLLQVIVKSIRERTLWHTKDAAIAWWIILATIPAGLAGLLLKSKVESAFKYPAVSALLLIGTAFLLFLAEIIGKRKLSLSQLTWWNALLIGLFQAGSIFPGISRSGACISGTMLQQFNRKDSGRFSFLLGIPIMVAAGFLGTLDLLEVKNLTTFLPILLIGFLTAALVGYLVIHWLLNYLAHHTLFPFVIYCVIIGIFTLGVGILNPNQLTAISPTVEGQIIGISVDPYLTWINLPLAECNQTISKFSLIFIEENGNSFISDYIRLTMNENEIRDHTAYLLGHEKLVISASNAVPLIKMPLDKINSLFSGVVNNLGDLQSTCPQCTFTTESTTLYDQPLQIWVYPKESYLQLFIDKNILPGIHTSDSTNLAPNPQSMVEALRISSTGINFLPEHWVDNSIKTISTIESSSESWKLPILAIPSDLSLNGINEMLACIQSKIQSN